MDERKKSRLKRLILLAAGGATAGLVITSLADVVPRPVTIEVGASDEFLQRREAWLTLSIEGKTVVEVSEKPRPTRQGPLSYTFWLSPEAHDVEIRLEGCPPVRRLVDPTRQRRLAFLYRCDQVQASIGDS